MPTATTIQRVIYDWRIAGLSVAERFGGAEASLGSI
jgi:hypothetical protein